LAALALRLGVFLRIVPACRLMPADLAAAAAVVWLRWFSNARMTHSAYGYFEIAAEHKRFGGFGFLSGGRSGISGPALVGAIAAGRVVGADDRM
jgi:hypothetical protein